MSQHAGATCRDGSWRTHRCWRTSPRPPATSWNADNHASSDCRPDLNGNQLTGPQRVRTLGEGESRPMGSPAASSVAQAARGMEKTQLTGFGGAVARAPIARWAKGPDAASGPIACRQSPGASTSPVRGVRGGRGSAHANRGRIPPEPHTVKGGETAAARGRRKPQIAAGGPSPYYFLADRQSPSAIDRFGQLGPSRRSAYAPGGVGLFAG